MKVFCIILSDTDPYFNLAAEEYFLKNFQNDFFVLWQSDQTVVVGKHQNALAEINHAFVRENNIRVARRLSGGGTVFHDPGNLNFTFIRTVENLSEVNFKVFTTPVIEALKQLGVEAYTTGRNDLLVAGKKISGNAEHVYKNRVLHHGTLLFNSRLENLKGALKVDLSRFEDRSVQSNRSPVTNIADHLAEPLPLHAFIQHIYHAVGDSLSDALHYELTQADRDAIQQLRDEKYTRWDWIYGYSPRYRYHHKLELEQGELLIDLTVQKGMVTEACFSGVLSRHLGTLLGAALLGLRHEFGAFKSALDGFSEQLQQEHISPVDLLNALF